jgi:hypothetical protein
VGFLLRSLQEKERYFDRIFAEKKQPNNKVLNFGKQKMRGYDDVCNLPTTKK